MMSLCKYCAMLVLFICMLGDLAGEATGVIYLDVYPRTAVCYLDNQLIDHAKPQRVSKTMHEILLTHPAYPDYTEKIILNADSLWVKVYPLRINYAPVGAKLLIEGKRSTCDVQDSSVLLLRSGNYDLKLRKALRSESKTITHTKPYSDYNINIEIDPRYEEAFWGHLLMPELMYYVNSGNTSLNLAGLGMKSEGRFGRGKLHWGLGLLEASVGIPSYWGLSVLSGETGLAYTSPKGSYRYALSYKANLINLEWVAADKYLGDYVDDDPDNYDAQAYWVYQIEDAYCIMMPNKWLVHRISANFSHYLSNKFDVNLSVGLSISPYYKWYRANDWQDPEAEWEYLSHSEVSKISPFPQGAQPFISISFRPLILHSSKR